MVKNLKIKLIFFCLLLLSCLPYFSGCKVLQYPKLEHSEDWAVLIYNDKEYHLYKPNKNIGGDWVLNIDNFNKVIGRINRKPSVWNEVQKSNSEKVDILFSWGDYWINKDWIFPSILESQLESCIINYTYDKNKKENIQIDEDFCNLLTTNEKCFKDFLILESKITITEETKEIYFNAEYIFSSNLYFEGYEEFYFDFNFYIYEEKVYAETREAVYQVKDEYAEIIFDYIDLAN